MCPETNDFAWARRSLADKNEEVEANGCGKTNRFVPASVRAICFKFVAIVHGYLLILSDDNLEWERNTARNGT